VKTSLRKSEGGKKDAKLTAAATIMNSEAERNNRERKVKNFNQAPCP